MAELTVLTEKQLVKAVENLGLKQTYHSERTMSWIGKLRLALNLGNLIGPYSLYTFVNPVGCVLLVVRRVGSQSPLAQTEFQNKILLMPTVYNEEDIELAVVRIRLVFE